MAGIAETFEAWKAKGLIDTPSIAKFAEVSGRLSPQDQRKAITGYLSKSTADLNLALTDLVQNKIDTVDDNGLVSENIKVIESVRKEQKDAVEALDGRLTQIIGFTSVVTAFTGLLGSFGITSFLITGATETAKTLSGFYSGISVTCLSISCVLFIVSIIVSIIGLRSKAALGLEPTRLLKDFSGDNDTKNRKEYLRLSIAATSTTFEAIREKTEATTRGLTVFSIGLTFFGIFVLSLIIGNWAVEKAPVNKTQKIEIVNFPGSLKQ